MLPAAQPFAPAPGPERKPCIEACRCAGGFGICLRAGLAFGPMPHL